MVSKAELDAMQNIDIQKVNANELVDVNTIAVDQKQPIKIRFENYLNEVKNPFFFRCGKTPVKIQFAPEGKTLERTLTDYFINLKNR